MQYQKITEQYKYDLTANVKLHENLDQYPTDSVGRYIVDFNDDTQKVLAIPLITTTTNLNDFNNVVNSEFTEFVDNQTNINPSLNLLSNELQYYKELDLKNKQLNRQLQLKIAELENRIVLVSDINNLQATNTTTTQ